jgi:hypothetical protein
MKKKGKKGNRVHLGLNLLRSQVNQVVPVYQDPLGNRVLVQLLESLEKLDLVAE